jgi:hypothetical protein
MRSRRRRRELADDIAYAVLGMAAVVWVLLGWWQASFVTGICALCYALWKGSPMPQAYPPRLTLTDEVEDLLDRRSVDAAILKVAAAVEELQAVVPPDQPPDRQHAVVRDGAQREGP